MSARRTPRDRDRGGEGDQVHHLVRRQRDEVDGHADGEDAGGAGGAAQRIARRSGSVAISKAAATGLIRIRRSLCWTAPFRIAKRSFRSLKAELNSSRL